MGELIAVPIPSEAYHLRTARPAFNTSSTKTAVRNIRSRTFPASTTCRMLTERGARTKEQMCFQTRMVGRQKLPTETQKRKGVRSSPEGAFQYRIFKGAGESKLSNM
ncbi:uncharacterized protein LOC129745238 [Uranotaenia lowii]|uniref:uncharacterized protein LOC129745238 n=1 Tax=Uranotaenia lowii TaxID=190385 RepID=UPI002479915E|nr:uncharacterized protein LOC129745238 [Uranotaenia lowii]